MKKFIVSVSLFFCVNYLFAQNQAIETEIRNLEKNEVQAVLNKDTVELKKIWDKDFVVNNPEGKIILAKSNSVERPVLQNQRTSFTRQVENVIVNGNIAISMGREVVVSMGDAEKSELKVLRRYTNIWMKKEGIWKLVARHANRICP